MSVFEINVSDESAAIAERFAAERRLPVEGVVVLALVNAAKDADGQVALDLKPANERLADLAGTVDELALSVPALKPLGEQLRYYAQFATTEPIPHYDGKKD